MAGKFRSPAYFCYQALWAALDWLYPPHCAGCGLPGQRWCGACQENTIKLTGCVCEQCGEPCATSGKCLLCRQAPPAFAAVRSWAAYAGPVRQALHSLKYHRNIALGDSLSIHLIDLYNQLNWLVDFIVPVPLSRSRNKARGYNQSALLAQPLSLAINIPYKPGFLQRVRETASQVGLNENERLQNVRGAFSAQPKHIAGKSILVIDDITTTGATMQQCAKALITAGARCVYGLTVARAVLHSHNDRGRDYPNPDYALY